MEKELINFLQQQQATLVNINKVLEAQQNTQNEIITKLSSVVFQSTNQLGNSGNSGNQELIADTISHGISEFIYDPENGLVFDKWYQRYEDAFVHEGKNLDDAAKLRLLLRKLNPIAHERYVNYILPKNPRDITFQDTIEKLKKLFGRQETLFSSRFKCLQTVKKPNEDFTTYAATVNKNCENSRLGTMTADQFKCLVFTIGLQSPSDAQVRTRLLTKLEDEKLQSEITLDALVVEAQRIINLKHDTDMVGTSTGSSFTVQAIRNDKKHYNSKKAKHVAGHNRSLPKTPCWSCGAMHYLAECTYATHKCRQCLHVGHKEGYCTARKPNKRQQQRHHINSKYYKVPSSKSIHKVGRIKASTVRKYVTVLINTYPVKLQLDTASDITVISEDTWKKVGSPRKLPTTQKAKSASNNPIKLIAEIECSMELQGECLKGNCFISKHNNLNILGTDWIEKFGLWDQPLSAVCNTVTAETQADIVTKLTAIFPNVFGDELGRCTKHKAQLQLKSEVIPVFKPKRPVAYAALQDIEAELDRMQASGIITPVNYSEWAAPIVAVKKPNGQVRICADYSTGLNAALESHQYPLPLPDDIFVKHANAKIFSNIDLSDAYLQVEVCEEARKLLTINTHKGLFMFNRLPPGVKSAPGVFQQIIDAMLAGLEGVSCYLDDIIISGTDYQSHYRNLKNVFQRLSEYGFRIKTSKCVFLSNKIKYLGHIVDHAGIRPDPAKISAIKTMPPPTNITELRSFLGAINYYGKFIRQMRELRAPLDELLKDKVKWFWSEQCQRAFEKFKQILSSDLLLTHYNPKLPIKVAADSSNVGIGAYIAHTFPDGTEKVVYHAARVLTPAEKNYSQIEKEALALIFAVTKFHRMIYGRKFTLQTDHKPLLAIFGSKKGIPAHRVSRLQRWALTLLAYDFDIEYISTTNFGYVDVLSRLIVNYPRSDEENVIACTTLEDEVQTDFNWIVDNLPINANMIKSATQKDKLLKEVSNFIHHGWPSKVDKQLQQYFIRRDSLSSINNCLMYNDRIIIPERLRKRVLHQLHKSHPGIERMTSLARSFVYWPNIEGEIKDFVQHCQPCASVAKSPVKAELSSWPLAEYPMQRIHIDIAGPVNGMFFLLIIDAYSKWPEIFQTTSVTSSVCIEKLSQVYARFGNPQYLVSDNGTQFTSLQFEEFCVQRGIIHLKTAPFSPQSNGQVERFVDTFKRTLKKLSYEGTTEEKIQTFLMCYRSTPSKSIPGMKSPAELFIGREMRTNLHLLRPVTESIGTKRNEEIEKYYNRKHGAKQRNFSIGQEVFAKVYKHNTWSWVPGKIADRIGAVMYLVILQNGRKIRSHINQLRQRHIRTVNSESNNLDLWLDGFELQSTIGSQQSTVPEQRSLTAFQQLSKMPSSLPPSISVDPQQQLEITPPSDSVQSQPEVEIIRRPVRSRKLPTYLQDYDISS